MLEDTEIETVVVVETEDILVLTEIDLLVQNSVEFEVVEPVSDQGDNQVSCSISE